MDIVESLCGSYPDNFQKLDIKNDPNFIFLNDPNFNARQLFDAEGATVFVNSFIECEHYVFGGWNFTPVKNLELYLHNSLFIGVTLIIGFQLIYKLYRSLQ